MFKLLLLCSGDVEVNPGPMTAAQAEQLGEVFKLLQDLNTRSVRFELGQTDLKSTVDEIKRNQESIESKVGDIRNRLDSVESKVIALDKTREELLTTQQIVECVKEENQMLRSRLDDIEDRLRRNNIIFHGLEDSLSENWAQTK